MKPATSFKMRVFHRYLGYFLAGIMTMYAISGILLIFRSTDFLKSEIKEKQQIDTQLSVDQLDPRLRLGKIQKEEGDMLYFEHGNYNSATGVVETTKMELPYFLDKMTHLHKASTRSPLFFLNVFFGISLLFFVVSAFYMYLPGTDVFKKGLYFTLAGIILTIVLIFV